MEHPILFSTPMVRGILAGRKTMTRRIFKGGARLASPEAFKTIDFKQWFIDYHDLMMHYCHYGKPGHILWVRERFRIEEAFDYDGDHYPEQIQYYASTPEEFECLDGTFEKRDDYKWKPGIHMPRAAARIFLKIKKIDIQKLHEITDDDCIKEGIEQNPFGFKNYEPCNPVDSFMNDNAPLLSYISLWNSINGKDSFKENPWVWVMEFEKMNYWLMSRRQTQAAWERIPKKLTVAACVCRDIMPSLI